MKNLAELKRSLCVGARFEVLNSCRATSIGDIRQVSFVNTRGIYSIKPDDLNCRVSLANGGRGYYLIWGAASCWKFRDNNIAALYSSSENQIQATLIIELRVIVSESERLRGYL